MLQPKINYYTPEEYLALEEKAEHRSEYYQGEIFAMSGGSANHNRITGNVLIHLNADLDGSSCEPFFTDMRLQVQKNGLYTYPDVMVVCHPLEFVPGRDDTLTNPVVIIEVLSKSTKDYDRGGKFRLYRDLESLQDYILIEQDSVYVEHYHKQADGRWLLTEFDQLDQVLQLEAIQVDLPLTQIYRNVDWENQ